MSVGPNAARGREIAGTMEKPALVGNRTCGLPISIGPLAAAAGHPPLQIRYATLK
jgi:hypothetical protein